MGKLKPLSKTFVVAVSLFTITSYLPDFRPPSHTQANVDPTPIDLRDLYQPVFGDATRETSSTSTYIPPSDEFAQVVTDQESVDVLSQEQLDPANVEETPVEEMAVEPDVAALPTQRFGDVLGAETDEPTTPVVEEPILGTVSLVGPTLAEAPVNPDATIMIPKIGVNSPIALNAPVNDRNAYMKALEVGVAHAKGTDLPSDVPNTNTYLFAHSTANEANIARYAAMFTKLSQLNIGDQVIVFYQGKRFDYTVEQQEVVNSFDTTVLTRKHDFPALTMQTCDPPGVPQNRRLVTARLVGMYDR